MYPKRWDILGTCDEEENIKNSEKDDAKTTIDQHQETKQERLKNEKIKKEYCHEKNKS